MTAFDEGLLDPATGAASVVGDTALLAAFVDVERAHLAALIEAGAASGPLDWTIPALDLPAIAAAAAGGGNPVIPVVAELRRRAPDELVDAVHLGLTSQDVLDSALMLLVIRALATARPAIRSVRAALAALADTQRGAPTAGRTLGQQAAPTTVGLRLAVLLDGITRTWSHLESLETPLQLGGSVGTVAVLTDRLGAEAAAALRTDVAARLGLDARIGVWQVERSTIALLGAGLAALLGALGRLGLEVAQASRTEVGELELELRAGEGGSSAMPQKRNPVPAVLLVANARRAPGLASTLLSAQLAVDDRPPGDWHAEWQPLRELLRLVVESAALADQVLGSLAVRPERARENLEEFGEAVHAERAQQVLARSIGRARAAEMVRSALGRGGFVRAIRESADRSADIDAGTVRRLEQVTTSGGAVGLSDRLIDAIRAAADGPAR